MNKHFYLWLFFGSTLALIVTVWVVVFSKTIKYSLARDDKTKISVSGDRFRELESKLKSFPSINQALLDIKIASAKERALQEAALKKMKEKLESATTTKN